MSAEKRLYFPILLIIFVHLLSSRFVRSQLSTYLNASLLSSTAGLSTSWTNKPLSPADSTFGLSLWTPILLSKNIGTKYHFCGFYCNDQGAECLLGIFFAFSETASKDRKIMISDLVWSANRDRPVKANATLQLGQDGNLVLADSDGTVVWSTNTTGKSVSGLNMTETGNLVLFDKANHAIWQSFDHPTDSMLPGQRMVPGQKLTASVSATNQSRGLLSLIDLNGTWATYIDSDPPQFYYSPTPEDSTNFGFYVEASLAQFMKFGPDGHLRVYRWDENALGFADMADLLDTYAGNCGYPMVCGRYGTCTSNGQCKCPRDENFFRPLNERKEDLGCSKLTPINCNSSQYHSFVELRNTTYFAFEFNDTLNSNILRFEGKQLEDCKKACLSNCSCKSVVFRYDSDRSRSGSCLLLNEVFSLIGNEDGADKRVFLKVQNSSQAHNQSPNTSPKSRLRIVIIGSTIAAFFGIIISITACFFLSKKRTHVSSKAEDCVDLEPILPGMLTRFTYDELKIITQDFSRKLGEGGCGSVYEGTLSNGTKIAVKRLDGLGHVMDSFLTEVKIVGGIHHVNLVKLVGFCAEKNQRLLIYEHMVNGSLDRWIYHKNQENRLTWDTRRRIITDIAKGLAYLHGDCNQKIIHLDIKPQNILLDQNFNAKISDFGLSKLIEKDTIEFVTRMRGTRGYLAPEWLSSAITEKVDVYAFGIVLLEVLCGRKNLDLSLDEKDVHLLSVFERKAEQQQQLVDIADENNEDMKLHKEEVTEMMSLAAWCLQGDYTKRPSMSLVVKVLEGLVPVETNLDYNFTSQPEIGTGTVSSVLPSELSTPR